MKSDARSDIFLAANHPVSEADMVILGVPYDGTSSFRSGSRYGPREIRLWSDVLETYSPEFDMDLEDIKVSDMGDLEIIPSDWGKVSPVIYGAIADIVSRGQIPVTLGGEHLVTLAAVSACLKHFPELVVLQLDAHLDLRQEYGSVKYSHATVMRRILDIAGPHRLFQLGVRSGTRAEWKLARAEKTLLAGIDDLHQRLDGVPLYVSLDLDVLDPSVIPETGTPEPGGMTFRELGEIFSGLKGSNIVGVDIVEYCPSPGSIGPSGVVAAKAVREMLFLCEAGLCRSVKK